MEARMASLTPPAATQSPKQTPGPACSLLAIYKWTSRPWIETRGADESYDFSEGGTLIDWRRGLRDQHHTRWRK